MQLHDSDHGEAHFLESFKYQQQQSTNSDSISKYETFFQILGKQLSIHQLDKPRLRWRFGIIIDNLSDIENRVIVRGKLMYSVEKNRKGSNSRLDAAIADEQIRGVPCTILLRRITPNTQAIFDKFDTIQKFWIYEPCPPDHVVMFGTITKDFKVQMNNKNFNFKASSLFCAFDQDYSRTADQIQALHNIMTSSFFVKHAIFESKFPNESIQPDMRQLAKEQEEQSTNLQS